jgi:site-specific DNA-adenine methylase
MGIKMKPPVSYQGGKQKIATKIVDAICPISKDVKFYDLCCGSGAISLELVKRGFPANNVTMVDSGPWGLFWEAIGNGSFDLDKMQAYCNLVPKNRYDIKPFIRELSKTAVNTDAVYIFLLLQACAFGGSAIGIRQGKWVFSAGWRDFWQPTLISNHQSCVNPMMPMPDTIMHRLKIIVPTMLEATGLCEKIEIVSVASDSVVYIDPPYASVTGYCGDTVDDVNKYASSLGGLTYVSEGCQLPSATRYILVSEKQSKGGINGSRSSVYVSKEWLNIYD